ncbi:UbiA family prenyltransferase [Plantactinospora sp. KBS50]|uniref:UbiA family prenyltransferase n=1 Tax=Plantactinospora sp. KBS50 TaxID=2024580 RepID=UPI0018DFB26E|nr:UbiA family prenyltransferase [Plantactinospora sp. KBS50]
MACVVEARPCVQVIFLLRFVAGFVLTRPAGAAIPLGRLLIAGISWELAVVSAYLFDGVMDVVEDRLNGSTRPIAAGALSRGFAAVVSGAAALASLAGAFVLGGAYPIFVGISLVLGYAYCAPPARLKRSSRAAGATVIICGLLTFLAGASVYGPVRINVDLTIFAVVMSLWMGLVGALAKDFSDTAGDAAAGCRTTALVRGDARARRLVARNALAVGIGFPVAAVVFAPGLTWPALAMSAGAVVVAWFTRSNLSLGSRKRRRLPYRAFMATQYAVNCALLLTGLILPS